MARQAKLFPEPATTIKVDQARAGPRLWVRRLGEARGSDPRGCRSGVASTLSGRPILERLPPIFIGIEGQRGGSRLSAELGSEHDHRVPLASWDPQPGRRGVFPARSGIPQPIQRACWHRRVIRDRGSVRAPLLRY